MTTDVTTGAVTTSPVSETSETAAGSAGSEWFERLHVAQLEDNPADVRGGQRDPARTAEMTASIREAGLLQALTVIPLPPTGSDEDGVDGRRFVVYAGHRRRDGARLAAAQLIAEALGYDTAADPMLVGLEVDPDDPDVRAQAGLEACAAADRLSLVPCLVRPDLAAAVGMDIATGLIENDQRDAITGGQRAHAAEQLSLAEGWTITRITAATGLSRANARAAAALPRLGEAARQAAYRGELSLEHVAVLDTLAELGATDDELGLLARSTTMFDHHVAELRKTLGRRSAAAGLLDDVDTHGWSRFEVPEGYPLDSPLAPLWSLTRAEDSDRDHAGERLLPRHGEHTDPLADRTAAGYAALPDHGVVLINDPWEDPHLEVVCADPETWGYRRDPHSTLYQPPEPTSPDTTDVDTRSDSTGPAGDDAPGTGPGVEDLGQGPEQSLGGDPDGTPARDPEENLDEEAREAAREEAARLAEQRRAEAEEREQQRRAEAERAAEQRRTEAQARERERERREHNERLEAERAAAAARRDALNTAASTRWSHAAGMLRTQKAAAGHTEITTVLLGRFPWLLADAEDIAEREQVAALVTEPDRDPRSGVQRWSPGRVTHRAVAVAAAALEDNLAGTAQLGRATIERYEAEPALWWLDHLVAHGYQLADVETATHAELTATLTELLAQESANSDGDGDSGDPAAPNDPDQSS